MYSTEWKGILVVHILGLIAALIIFFASPCAIRQCSSLELLGQIETPEQYEFL